MRAKKPIDLEKESRSYWSSTLKRQAARVKVEADEDFSKYRLMDGKRCIYSWSERDALGYELAHFLVFDLLPPLREVVLKKKKTSDKWRRPDIYRDYILEQLKRIHTSSKRHSSLVHLVHENTCSHLERLERNRRLPANVKASVSKTYVRRVLDEQLGYRETAGSPRESEAKKWRNLRFVSFSCALENTLSATLRARGTL